MNMNHHVQSQQSAQHQQYQQQQQHQQQVLLHQQQQQQQQQQINQQNYHQQQQQQHYQQLEQLELSAQHNQGSNSNGSGNSVISNPPPSGGSPSSTAATSSSSSQQQQQRHLCSGCGRGISERYLLHALDRCWHHNCLKCSCCHAVLADLATSCYSKQGFILCRDDYHRLYGTGGPPGGAGGVGGPSGAGLCSACDQTIPPHEYVMRGPGAPNAGQLVYHLHCFVCSKCGSHLRQGDRYYMLSGSLVCESDWQKLLSSSKTNATGGATTVKKAKVGRPRRSRD